jgi:short-subunit dehydrogenase
MKKTVLITGATNGIGEASVHEFLRKSWNVIATGRSQDKLNKLEKIGAEIFCLDITNEQNINKLIQHIVNKNIHIDVLVNNAGYGQFGTIEETSIEKARNQFETNVFGLAALSQKIIPLMRSNGAGRIINISSIAGITSMPGGGWYSASKFAVEAISDTLRWELNKFNIRVVIIEPGPIKSGFSEAVRQNVVIADNSPYGDLVKKLTTKFTKSIKGGTVEGCAKIIYKAATKKNPKTRYVYTKEWKIIKLLLILFPPKIVDIFVKKIFISS